MPGNAVGRAPGGAALERRWFPAILRLAILSGADGVELEKPPFRAVFLPQVAPEQGWDRETMLEHLATKAGLPRDGWKGARFLTFQAEVFGEG